jgi:hypothetical protein
MPMDVGMVGGRGIICPTLITLSLLPMLALLPKLGPDASTVLPLLDPASLVTLPLLSPTLPTLATLLLLWPGTSFWNPMLFLLWGPELVLAGALEPVMLALRAALASTGDILSAVLLLREEGFEPPPMQENIPPPDEISSSMGQSVGSSNAMSLRMTVMLNRPPVC